jgi:hypothetical protein
MAGKLREVVLLYNDRELEVVKEIHRALKARLKGGEHATWFAYEDMTMYGDLFRQIRNAISRAVGVVIFYGDAGLGAFFENIELVTVLRKRWKQGEGFGVLVAHLPGSTAQTHEELTDYPSVNHRRDITDIDEIADRIEKMITAKPSQPDDDSGVAA